MKNTRHLKLIKIIKRNFLFFFLFILVVEACTKKIGEEPKAPVPQKCDTISYAQDIAPIVQKNCSISGCHVPPTPTGPNVLLNTYDLFKDKAVSGRIKARVIDENPSRMPPAGITPEEKQLIECWLTNGYLP